MTEIMIFIATGLAGLSLFFGIRLLAEKVGPANEAVARAALARMPNFEPGPVHAYLGSAIGYDPVRNLVGIWEKHGGARLVDPDGVAAWHSGMLLTQVLNRTTATPMIQLYARPQDRRPFFKVGVLKETDCAAWRDRLQAAFGAGKERETDARILGV